MKIGLLSAIIASNDPDSFQTGQPRQRAYHDVPLKDGQRYPKKKRKSKKRKRS